MNTIAIIPARLQSKRFPKKILFPIDEKPMVVHVYENVKKSESIDDVIIAVDDDETIKELKKWKVKTVMTSSEHQSGTDRVHEASKDKNADVIVNVQADEPFLDFSLVDILVDEFDDMSIEMATVAGKELSAEQLNDSNTVKVLLDSERFATAFRRDPVDIESAGYYHHAGIYAYRQEALNRFTSLEPSTNEQKFKLEQLRALDNGISIKVVLTDKVNKGIDTLEDIKELNK
ncbi:MAG: 3-deoxy-manno-octulosonate cytidylyltransferase [Candidatus Neomarinimicrobiota bacterium]|nr:3-deoxy-manno-octulosonate cytidylyltransferase [Candidatus Neomarinimicrobiota bacterium]